MPARASLTRLVLRLEMAIRTNPSYSTAHENLGDVYAKLASQAYSKALQLDNDNQAVPPKLALIRELFSPQTRQTGKPAAAPVHLLAATPVAAKPAVATPTPVPAPAPPAATAATKPPAVAAAPVAAPAQRTSAKAGQTRAQPTKEVESTVKAWATAWSSKDVKGYLGCLRQRI